MRTLALEVVGPESGPTAWFVHGILGRGRNWRTFARSFTDATGWRAVLLDLRCHGDSVGLPAPAGRLDLGTAAADLRAVAANNGAPRLVVGHSFGGKVVLTWASELPDADPCAIWSIDSPPGADRPATERSTDAGTADPGTRRVTVDPAAILDVLDATAVPAADRAALAAPLRAAGTPEAIVAWLLTSARRDDDGWRWGWELDGVRTLLASYFAADLWPYLDETRREVHLVRATRSDRWSETDRKKLEALPLGGPVRAHAIDAGHWVHVDAPDALLTMLTSELPGGLRG